MFYVSKKAMLSLSHNESVAQLIRKFPAFYRNGIFFTVFTRARRWTFTWAR
jgi:hypothetical protein